MSAEGLTEAERESLARELFAAEQCDRRQRQALDDNWRERLNDSDQREYRTMAAELAPFIERILADRLAAVQAERRRADRSNSALLSKVKRLQDQIARAAMEPGQDRQKAMHAYAFRAESAEAERDAALAALDRVKALLAKPDLSSMEMRTQIRAAVEGGRS